MAEQPVLDDLRVLELGGGVASAMTVRFLHGYGARVTRYEPTDYAQPVPLTGAQRIAYLSGIEIMSGSAADLGDAIAAVDMIVSDRRPKELIALGIDYSALRAERPDLVVVSVTPFGLTGPNADLETTNAVSFAAGGIMSLTGDPNRAPLITGGEHAHALGAANAFGAAVMAWFGRTETGRGDLVDISLQECAAGMLEYYGPITSYNDLPAHARYGNSIRATWAIYPCADGWAGVFALARQVPALFALLNDPELDEPRFTDPLQRALEENNDALVAKLYVFFADRTMAEIRELSLQSRVPFGVVLTPADLLDGETPADRGFWDEVPGDDERPVRIPGRPFPGFPWSSEPVAAAESPASERATPVNDSPAVATSPASPARLPLQGIRVLDLTMMWAGPFATLRLAEMGADVIKIESPTAWDNIRTLIPQEDAPPEPWNSGYYFNAYNRDKRSLTLDLAQPAGRDLFLRLVEQSDVVIENYRSDVLDKLALGYETLRARKSDIVLVSMAAFGKQGADAGFVGFGPVIETMSGLASLSGYGDGEPFKTGISYGDPVAGTFAAAAVGLALQRRHRTGEGLHVDLAQRETASVLIGDAFVEAADGSAPVHRGNRHATMAPQGCYRLPETDSVVETIGETVVAGVTERWLVLSVRHDADWSALCSVVGQQELASLTVDQRRARHDELDRLITDWAASAEAPADPAAALQDAGVPAIEMHNTRSLLDDPHLADRGFWHTTPHPCMHSYRQNGVPWRFADSRPAPRRHSPLFGEHNVEILQGMLDLDDDEIAELAEALVIADAPVNPTIG